MLKQAIKTNIEPVNRSDDITEFNMFSLGSNIQRVAGAGAIKKVASF